MRKSAPQPVLRKTDSGGRNKARKYRQMSDLFWGRGVSLGWLGWEEWDERDELCWMVGLPLWLLLVVVCKLLIWLLIRCAGRSDGRSFKRDDMHCDAGDRVSAR